jgi:hypothetical protein
LALERCCREVDFRLFISTTNWNSNLWCCNLARSSFHPATLNLALLEIALEHIRSRHPDLLRRHALCAHRHPTSGAPRRLQPGLVDGTGRGAGSDDDYCQKRGTGREVAFYVEKVSRASLRARVENRRRTPPRFHRNRQNIFSRPQNVDLSSASNGRGLGSPESPLMPAIDAVPSSLPSNGYGRSVPFEDDEDDFDM